MIKTIRNRVVSEARPAVFIEKIPLGQVFLSTLRGTPDAPHLFLKIHDGVISLSDSKDTWTGGRVALLIPEYRPVTAEIIYSEEF